MSAAEKLREMCFEGDERCTLEMNRAQADKLIALCEALEAIWLPDACPICPVRNGHYPNCTYAAFVASLETP